MLNKKTCIYEIDGVVVKEGRAPGSDRRIKDGNIFKESYFETLSPAALQNKNKKNRRYNTNKKYIRGIRKSLSRHITAL